MSDFRGERVLKLPLKEGQKWPKQIGHYLWMFPIILNTNYLTLQLRFSRDFPSFDVEVEKKIGLTSNGSHIIDEITKGNIIFQNDINGQIK